MDGDGGIVVVDDAAEVYTVQLDAPQMDALMSVSSAVSNILGFQLVALCLLVGFVLLFFFKGGWRH